MPVLRQGDPGWKDPFRPKRPKGSKRQRMIARQEARRVMNKAIETKRWYGRTLGYVNTDYNGLVINVFTNPATGANLTQGTDRDNYIGDTFKPIALRVKFQAESIPPALSLFATWTVMLMQVKGGGVPNPANILQSVGNSQTPFSYVDPTYMDTFRILARKTFTAQNQNYGTYTKAGSFNISAKKLRKVNMLAPGFVPTANGLFIVVYGSAAVAANPIQLTWELVFKDA